MFGLDLMWLICHLASTWKSSLRGSISTCVWCGNLYMTWMIHVEATWKSSLRDSVSNRAFSKFKALLSLTNASPLSFTLSLSHRLEHSHSPSTLLALPIHSHSLSVTDANLDPLSLSQPHRRRPSLTLSLSQPHRPRPTLTYPLTLSLTNPVSCLCQSPSPPSHRHPVTVFTLSLTISTLTQCPLFHIHQLRQKNRDVSNGHNFLW